MTVGVGSEQIMKMNAAYMNDPSNILAVVNPATNDPAGIQHCYKPRCG